MCPVMLQLTLHTGASNVCSKIAFHSDPAPPFCVQISTDLSSEHDATMLWFGISTGAHATSRTQSECDAPSFEIGDDASSSHCPVSNDCLKKRMRLSHPAVTNRGGCNSGCACGCCDGSCCCTAESSVYAPYGAQLTELTPNALSETYSTLQLLSGSCVRTETRPSELAAATCRPNSEGANAMPLTDDSCKYFAPWRRVQSRGLVSRWMSTDPSKEHDASSTPNLGWLQDTCQTGPSWP
mmetsp:Transcript_14355/g.40853  ORF Transcript_14355/g.40853 Transcript_14355/m.40853 type:complete len:239 (+) Transcript_14355:280-996(+)